MSRALSDWLQGYLAYTENQESPETYHFWTGMALMAAALRRNVFLHRVKYDLYPNLYVLLLADSAKTRKSIPLQIGVELLSEAIPDIYILSDSATPEGIIRYMNRSVTNLADGKRTISSESHLLLYADELASLFGYDKQRASKLSILLTRGYSSPKAYRHTTAKDSMLTLYNVYFNLIAATAPSNLRVLPDDAVGGLIGRLVIVRETRKRRSIAWEEESYQDDDELRKSLVTDLYRIGQLKGQFQPTAEARDFFKEWYDRQEDIHFDDPNLDAFHSRCHDTALKIACLISVSRGDSLVVESHHVAAGIAYVEKQLPEFARIVTWAGNSDYSQKRSKFIELLKRNGGYMSRRAMLRMMAVPLSEFDELCTTLTAEGTIEKRDAGPRNDVFRLADQPPDFGTGG